MLMVLIIEQFNFINSFVILFLFVLIDKVVDCCICFATQQRLQMKSKVEEFFPTLETQLQVDCCDTIANPSTTHLLKTRQMCCLLSVCGRLLCFGRLCYQQVHERHEISQSIASLLLGGLQWNFCKSSNHAKR